MMLGNLCCDATVGNPHQADPHNIAILCQFDHILRTHHLAMTQREAEISFKAGQRQDELLFGQNAIQGQSSQGKIVFVAFMGNRADPRSKDHAGGVDVIQSYAIGRPGGQCACGQHARKG